MQGAAEAADEGVYGRGAAAAHAPHHQVSHRNSNCEIGFCRENIHDKLPMFFPYF
jgi:hypothetical protein